jgi:hypothetical protein
MNLKLRNALISGQHPHFQGEHEHLVMDTGYACLTTGSTLPAFTSAALEMSSTSYFSLLGVSVA